MTYGLAKAVVCVAWAISVTGCVAWKQKEVVADPAETALVEAARGVEKAWATSAQLQADVAQASDGLTLANAGESGTPDEDVPVDLLTRVDMSWLGELVPAVDALCASAGWVTRVVGVKRGPPILVSLDRRNATIWDLLRDAGTQAGVRADVVVDGDARAIEVVYRD